MYYQLLVTITDEQQQLNNAHTHTSSAGIWSLNSVMFFSISWMALSAELRASTASLRLASSASNYWKYGEIEQPMRVIAQIVADEVLQHLKKCPMTLWKDPISNLIVLTLNRVLPCGRRRPSERFAPLKGRPMTESQSAAPCQCPCPGRVSVSAVHYYWQSGSLINSIFLYAAIGCLTLAHLS